MRARQAIARTCLLLGLAGSALAAPASSETEFFVSTSWRVAAGLEDSAANLSEVSLRPVWEGDLGARARFTVSGRFRADLASRLDRGGPDLRGYAPFSRPALIGDRTIAELRDAYLEFEAGPAYFTLGKQQIVWGELEGFQLLDVVNPRNFREFILEDQSEARIGLWAANLELALPAALPGDWIGQLIWVPDPSVHEIPGTGATFEFQAPRFRFGEAPGSAPPSRVRTQRPDDLFGDAGYGGRLVGLVGGWDLSLAAYSGIDPEPLGRIDVQDQGIEIVRVYERREVIGGSAARNIGPVTARLEAAWRPERSHVVRTPSGLLEAREVDQFGIALVTDFIAPRDVFVSFQVFHSRVMDAPPGLVRPDEETLTSLLITRSFANDRLDASLQWYAGEGGEEGIWRPKFSYALSDTTSIEISADIFYGNADGVFGQFDDRDRLMLTLRRDFF